MCILDLQPVTLRDGDRTQQDFSGICFKIFIKKEFSKGERCSVPISHSPAPRGLLSLSSGFRAACLSNSLPFSSRSHEETYGHASSDTSALLPKVGQCSMSSARLFLGRHAPCSGMARMERAGFIPDVTLHPAAKSEK